MNASVTEQDHVNLFMKAARAAQIYVPASRIES